MAMLSKALARRALSMPRICTALVFLKYHASLHAASRVRLPSSISRPKPRIGGDIMAIIGHKEELGDPRVSNIAREDTKKWYQKPNLRSLYLILVPCGLGVEWTSGFDSSMMNSLQAVPSWVECGLMAVPFVPSMSQLLGRRWTIALGSLIMFLGAGLQAGARNQDMFLASRWVLGFGIPFAIVNASSLIGELSYERERPVMTSLFNASWFVGAIVAAGTTYGTFQMDSTWSWRLPSLLQLVPSMCQVCFLPFCPESPRWLVSKDRADEAFAILAKYHSEGDHGEEFVRLEFAQIQSTLALEKEASKGFVWANVYRDAPMRRRFLLAITIGIFAQWSGNGLLSFYMKKILNLVGIQDNLTVQKIILTSAGIAVLVFIFFYTPFYNIGWNALAYTYLVELFPYSQRAQGIAVEQLAVRIAVFFNTYVNPIALDAIGWRYYIVYCVWILFEIATVYFLFPETKGRSLEELAFMFEGKEVQAKQNQGVDKQLELAPAIGLESINRRDSGLGEGETRSRA
ncbi:hypothetical protein G7054_g13013 [Neopestalotiopsis clavispora]|nr:hypothetical protein G7054_g13013 [Neopestalotiopsis clavispora]